MSDKTYIRRSKHDKENPYMMLRRETAQNKGLSYEALGLLTYLLSKPDDWRVQIGDLQRGKKHGLLTHTAGRDKVRTLLDELCEKGYARREAQRHDPETGRFEYGDYEVAEMPIFLEPCTEKPSTDNPYTVNPTLQSIEGNGIENTLPNGTDKPSKPLTPFVEMKNAIHKAFGYEEKTTTPSTWMLIGKAASELLKAGAQPSDMAGLHRYCAGRFDNFKAMALATNWSDYQASLKRPSSVPSHNRAPIAPIPTPTLTPDEIAARKAQGQAARKNLLLGGGR